MDNEKYFIGQILHQPDIAFKTTLRDDELLSPYCRSTFITVKSLLQQGLEADLPTIFSHNKEVPVSALMQMQDMVASPVNWEHYEKQVKEQSRRRGIKKVCEVVLHNNLTSQDMIEQIMKAVDGYVDYDDYRIVSLKESINQTVDEIEWAYNSKGQLRGIPTGIKSLDFKLNGFQKRRFYVIGARPSQGKTALLVNFIFNANRRIGVMSAESAKKEINERLISLCGRINSEHLAKGELGQTGLRKLNEACGKLYEKDIWYYDKPNMRLDELLLKAREMKQRFNIEALFVDYIQQIQCDGDREHEKVAKVSTSLKALARNLDIPVIAAAQLKRPDTGKPKPPELHDLGNSSQIERDADAVLLIHHGELSVGGEKKQGTFLLMEKNRDGATGFTQVMFRKEYYGFHEIEKNY